MWIRYTGPPGYEPPEPTILAIGTIRPEEVIQGKRIRIAVDSRTKRTCEVLRFQTNQMCQDGRRADVVTVRPLSTLN